MGQPVKQTVQATEFVGLMLNNDPHSLPPGGATDQVNVASTISGELLVRLGYLEVNFEDS